MVDSLLAEPLLDVRAAAVREVSAAFAHSWCRDDSRVQIDPLRAASQHHAYVEFLREAGIAVTVLPAEERSPEGPFVEDLAVVLGPRRVILSRPASPVRIGEEDALRRLLIGSRDVLDVPSGARFDGNDVISGGQVLYLAVGNGIDEAGAVFIERAAALERLAVVRVPVRARTPLRRLLTPLGGNVILHVAGTVTRAMLPGVELLAAPEAAGANVLVIRDRVMVPEEAPRTASLLDRQGFRVTMLPFSEFLAAGAGPTRLSLRW